MTNKVVAGFFPRLSSAENALALLRCLGFVQSQILIQVRHWACPSRRSWFDLAYEAIPEGVISGLLSGTLAGLLFAALLGGSQVTSLTAVACAWIGAFGGVVAGVVIHFVSAYQRTSRNWRPAGLVIQVNCPHEAAESIAKEIFLQSGAKTECVLP